MEYTIPSKVQVGPLNLVTIIIKKYEVRKILIITSPSVSNFEEMTSVIEILRQDYEVSIYNSIKPDAPLNDLIQLVSEYEKPDILLAIGGGSVIDSTKALSVCWQGTDLMEMFTKKATLPKQNIPIIAVPTTAGTGAELSYGAILYDVANKFKGGLRGEILQPDSVLIDVNLYAKAPKKLMAEVGFDCMTHAMETYLSTASSPLVQYQSVTAIQTVFEHLPKAYQGSTPSLEKVAIAAALMGVNLAMSTTCLPHRIQYAIGPLTNTSHAYGLVMLYRGWLSSIVETPEFQKLVDDLGFEHANELVDRINQLKRDLDIDYRLSDCGLSASDVDAIAENVTGNVNNDPCYKSIETIKKIISDSI